MLDEKDAPEPAPLPPAAQPEAPLTAAVGLTASLNRARAVMRAADERLALERLYEAKTLGSLRWIENLEKQRRAMEAALGPSWFSAAAEAARAAKMQVSYTGTMGLGPSISSALATLEHSVLAKKTALSPQWLSLTTGISADSLRPSIAASLLDHDVQRRLADQFEQLTRPAMGLARVLEGAERRHREIEAMLALPRAVHTAWDTVARLNAAAVRTWDYLGTNPDRLAVISPRLAGAPVIEVYAATHAATLVSAPEETEQLETVPLLEDALDDIGDGFEARLASLDPALVTMYRGGVERVEGGGSDWARQALTSFRELSTHALHLLAPDAEVKPWARPDHFDKGKLTRKARLEYILREVDSGDLADFLKIDLQSMLALFNLMHTVHKKNPALDQRQLRVLHNRIRGAIIALLEAAGR